MQGGACKKVTWGQGTLGGKRLNTATMGATGRDSKITKRRHGDIGENKNITPPRGTTTVTGTRYVEGDKCTKQLNLRAPYTFLNCKPSRAPNKIIEGHVPMATSPSPPLVRRGIGTETPTKDKGDGRVLPRELLDNGQGKCDLTVDSNSDMDISVEVESTTAAEQGTQKRGAHELLDPPIINETRKIATGATTKQLRKQNKHFRNETLREQPIHGQWTRHVGDTALDDTHWERRTNTADEREMAPQGLAQQHEAADLLADWEKFGCPTHTGRDWTFEEIQAAINRGPHKSALEPDAIAHFAAEVADKVAKGQARVVLWDDIKFNHPPRLKVSPVAAIPHKSRAYRSILDLSFSLRLEDGGVVKSVNDTTTKLAPRGAIDQLGHSLKRIIHAFAEADDDAVILMAKWDIQDGFWRLNCREGEEWNFCYVWPQAPGEPCRLVVPTSLQMGWVESPPYFCAASETARDVAAEYIETPIGSLPEHKFEQWAGAATPIGNNEGRGGALRYILEVYVDDFISCIIPTTREQVEHVARGIMHGIHDVFPPSEDATKDPISNKKLQKGDGTFATTKCILGFDFDGVNKTIWLEEAKRATLLTILHQWLRGATRARRGIPFAEFESVTAKLRHAFTALREGRGLLSPCNWVIQRRPKVVYLHRDGALLEAIRDIHTILRNSTLQPTHCKDLVAAWPDYIGIVDASSHGVGGVIIGELSGVPPTVFRLQWPPDISNALVSFENPQGTITNSDLEMAGVLLLWLCLEGVAPDLAHKHVALFSDNSPSVSWTTKMASKHSRVAAQLVRALALRLNLKKSCPITPIHIPGIENALTDIPSRSFGSVPEWHCTSHEDLLTLFNSKFPLPSQASWTVFQFESGVITRVISALRMRGITLGEWQRLPTIGRHIGQIGPSMSNLWDWTLTHRGCSTRPKSVSLQDLPPESDRVSTAGASASRLEQSLALSRPLDRRSHWPVALTQQKCSVAKGSSHDYPKS